MITKLEGTLSNVQQHIEQLQTPTMGVTINNKSTTTEPFTGTGPPQEAIGPLGSSCFLGEVHTALCEIR